MLFDFGPKNKEINRELKKDFEAETKNIKNFNHDEDNKMRKTVHLSDSKFKEILPEIKDSHVLSPVKKINKIEFRRSTKPIESIQIFKSVNSSRPTEPDSIITSMTSHKNKYLSKKRSYAQLIESKETNRNLSISSENFDSNIFESKYKNQIIEYQEQSDGKQHTDTTKNNNFNGVLISVSGSHYKEINYQRESKVVIEAELYNTLKQKKLNLKLPCINHQKKNTNIKIKQNEFGTYDEYYLTSTSCLAEKDCLQPSPINPKIKNIFSKRHLDDNTKFSFLENFENIKESK